MIMQDPEHPSSSRDIRMLALKFGLFLSLVTISQFLVGSFFPFDPNPGNPGYLQRNLDAGRPNVVFLGDSVMRYTDPGDASAAGIHTLYRKAAGYRVEPILVAQGGMHLDAFRHYARLIANHENKPRAVFIEVNPAGLTDITHPYLFFRRDSMAILGMIHPWFQPFIRALAVFKHPMTRPGMTMEEYYRIPVKFEDETIGQLHEFAWNNPKYRIATPAHHREKILTRYFCEPKPRNFKIRAIREIAKTLENAGIPAIFYITPVDIEFCRHYWPGFFEQKISEKVEMVEKQLKGTNARLLDLSFDLPHDAFSYPDYVDEHLKLEGRGYVAQRLADATRNLLE